jgi:membrane protease YdiL (CAAX protease family)
MYLAPGIFAFLGINYKPIFDFAVGVTGLNPAVYQLILFLFVTYIWHIVTPFLMLRFVDKLSVKQCFAYLGFTRFDWKGVLIIAPILLLLATLISYPYLKWIGHPMRAAIDSIPILAIPKHSLFNSYQTLYNFPFIIILLMLIGNLVGEEVYFRGYLLKKTAFLGKYNALMNGILFAVYHLWQIPQTWPLVGISLFFSFLMVWRKSIYPLILFHGLLNFVWPSLYYLIFGTNIYF